MKRVHSSVCISPRRSALRELGELTPSLKSCSNARTRALLAPATALAGLANPAVLIVVPEAVSSCWASRRRSVPFTKQFMLGSWGASYESNAAGSRLAAVCMCRRALQVLPRQPPCLGASRSSRRLWLSSCNIQTLPWLTPDKKVGRTTMLVTSITMPGLIQQAHSLLQTPLTHGTLHRLPGDNKT